MRQAGKTALQVHVGGDNMLVKVRDIMTGLEELILLNENKECKSAQTLNKVVTAMFRDGTQKFSIVDFKTMWGRTYDSIYILCKPKVAELNQKLSI